MEIVSINGMLIEQAVNNRIGKCINNIDTEVKTYCSDYYLKGATTYEFVVTAKKESATKLSKFCWLQVYILIGLSLLLI